MKISDFSDRDFVSIRFSSPEATPNLGANLGAD